MNKRKRTVMCAAFTCLVMLAVVGCGAPKSPHLSKGTTGPGLPPVPGNRLLRVRVQGLDGDTPIPQPKTDAPVTGPTQLISTPILGGLHHRYQRVAA